MTQIDFYTHVDDKLVTACRLTLKALQQGLRVMILTQDAAATDKMDKLLWSVPSTGFTPHCRSGDPLAAKTPVIIDHLADVFPHDEVLINLQGEQPPFFSRFQRVIEIVGTDHGDKAAGRGRFRFYRDRGYEIRHHDMSGGGGQ